MTTDTLRSVPLFESLDEQAARQVCELLDTLDCQATQTLFRTGDAGDSNNNRSWVASLSARPTRFYGLEVGGSAYRDKVSPTVD